MSRREACHADLHGRSCTRSRGHLGQHFGGDGPDGLRDPISWADESPYRLRDSLATLGKVAAVSFGFPLAVAAVILLLLLILSALGFHGDLSGPGCTGIMFDKC